jgi:hypothetical protein
MSSKENTLREMVGHERRQDLIGVLASLPDAIGGALQRLSVRQYSVCTMSAAYNKYTAVVETELLPAEKRAQKERSKFRVKRERLEILHPQWVSVREGEESSLKENGRNKELL